MCAFLCNAFTVLAKNSAAVETELSDEEELPQFHDNRAHGETEMQDETEPNRRCNGNPNTSPHSA